MDARAHLQAGCNELGLAFTDQQIEQLLEYLQLIQLWNKAYNLVGTSDSHELIQKHLLDSLAIVQYVEAGPVLDVGSGAGLPGIPLAIAQPGISFTLLDANGKKTRFMRQVALETKLGNVEIVHTRIEQYQPKEPAKVVLSRAFAPLDKALKLLLNVCAPQGTVLIMLGAYPENLPHLSNIQNIQVMPISVPGLSSQRHLLVAQRD